MTMTYIASAVVQGWCMMKPNNYRIPVVTEREPTADELYLQALKAKYKYATYDEYLKEINETIEHYKKLAWRDQR